MDTSLARLEPLAIDLEHAVANRREIAAEKRKEDRARISRDLWAVECSRLGSKDGRLPDEAAERVHLEARLTAFMIEASDARKLDDRLLQARIEALEAKLAMAEVQHSLAAADQTAQPDQADKAAQASEAVVQFPEGRRRRVRVKARREPEAVAS